MWKGTIWAFRKCLSLLDYFNEGHTRHGNVVSRNMFFTETTTFHLTFKGLLAAETYQTIVCFKELCLILCN
jgi:hypothetical protein